MAGDWIKLEHTTPDKPEVWQIAATLKMTPEEVIGRVLRVWIWADQQSQNGHAVSVTDLTIDAVARHAGFAKAMRAAGWLSGDEGALDFPHFERHNGKTAKNRALANDRQRNRRDSGHDSVAETLRTERDKSVTREEKRRSKSLTTPLPPSFKKKGEPKKTKSQPKTQNRGNGSGRWWLSEQGIERKARELGMWPARPGESMDDFKQRLSAADRKAHHGDQTR